MRNHIVTIAVALALAAAAAPAGAIVHTLQVNAHGQCEDGNGNGGGGEAHVFPWTGEVDAVDAQEARSIADGVVQFANGTAHDAEDGNPGDDDACPSDDTNADGKETHEDEDHVSASFYWLEGAVQVGVCYDNEGLHAPGQCHGDSGDIYSRTPALP